MELCALTIVLSLFWRSGHSLSPSFDVVVAKDGTGNFTTIGEAISAAPNYSSNGYHIKIKAGMYTENIVIGSCKTNLILIGDGMDDTRILGNRSFGSGFGTYDTATVGIHGQGFIAQGLSFENLAGPKKGQAVAVLVEANYTAFYRCRLKGYQDTLYTKIGEQFFRECEIFGTVDFIFGDASVVFQNCIIIACRPLPQQYNTITAQGRELAPKQTGTVFHNCTITAAPDLRKQKRRFKTYLGRPWRLFSRTVIIQSFLDDIIDRKGWINWKGKKLGSPYYAEFKNRGPGANTDGRVQWARVINSTEEAVAFTVRNFIHGEAWIPSTGIPFFPDLL
ncbi:hypothetical protein RJ640_014072 [Escallonia rubra]|uniref:Pectinesterase n=1 Tax=Escallonia rubra TaxID=112253 RepID=A0AA88U975_9ASTE|nr:hypothetical protein RJ640_014072 [Escallonia rubra]